jgi:hypothetical protein
LKGLKKLDLQDTAITDAGLNQLAPLTQLEELSLSRTKVGDGSLAFLLSRTKLTRLSLAGTKISHTAYLQLQKGLPGCTMETWETIQKK